MTNEDFNTTNADSPVNQRQLKGRPYAGLTKEEIVEKRVSVEVDDSTAMIRALARLVVDKVIPADVVFKTLKNHPEPSAILNMLSMEGVVKSLSRAVNEMVIEREIQSIILGRHDSIESIARQRAARRVFGDEGCEAYLRKVAQQQEEARRAGSRREEGEQARGAQADGVQARGQQPKCQEQPNAKQLAQGGQRPDDSPSIRNGDFRLSDEEIEAERMKMIQEDWANMSEAQREAARAESAERKAELEAEGAALAQALDMIQDGLDAEADVAEVCEVTGLPEERVRGLMEACRGAWGSVRF